jgi:hypothetical protein
MTDAEVFNLDPELRSLCDEASEEELLVLKKLHEDPTNDAQIEIYIYLCFLCFQKLKRLKYLEPAIQLAEGWLAVTPAHHPDYNRRHSLLNTLTIWGHRFQEET